MKTIWLWQALQVRAECSEHGVQTSLFLGEKKSSPKSLSTPFSLFLTFFKIFYWYNRFYKQRITTVIIWYQNFVWRLYTCSLFHFFVFFCLLLRIWCYFFNPSYPENNLNYVIIVPSFLLFVFLPKLCKGSNPISVLYRCHIQSVKSEVTVAFL